MSIVDTSCGSCVDVCVEKRLSRGSIRNFSNSVWILPLCKKHDITIAIALTMKNCTLLIALAWLARFLFVQANSPPRRRIRTTVVKKGSSIPLPSSPFGDTQFRNSYRMHSRKYHNKGKNHERQLQNKKTRKRNDNALKGTSQRFDWKRGRALKGRGLKKLKGEDKKRPGNAFRKFVAWWSRFDVDSCHLHPWLPFLPRARMLLMFSGKRGRRDRRKEKRETLKQTYVN